MRTTIAIVASAVLLAAGAGCQENWQSFFIHDNKGIGSPPECLLPTDETAPGLLGGVLDVSVGTNYAAGLFVENALVPRADPGRLIAESNGIFVQGAYIRYEPDPVCGGAFPEYEARFSAYVPPGGTATIGVWLIPSIVGQVMADTLADCGRGRMDISVIVQLYGVTQAGTDMETQEFEYPITLCNGCLIACPVDLSSTEPGCQCDCASNESLEDPPCNIGQDELVDCRYAPPCVEAK